MFDLYIQYEYWFAAAQLVLAMLGMGATLRVRDFVAVLKSPRGILVGMSLQLLMVPLAAALFLTVLELDAGVAIGLALCAAIPGGTMSNVFTFLGRGHVALSIALTGVTTLACLVTTPFILALLISQHMPADFAMPTAQIAREITLLLLCPLLLGMLFLHYIPGKAAALSKNCIRGSVFVILLIVIGATGSGRVDVEAFGAFNLVVVLALIVTLSLLSFLLPRLLKLETRDTTAINIEVTVRNGNLGLLIKASLFPAVLGSADPIGDQVLFTVLLFGGYAMLVGMAQVYLHRYLNRRQAMSYPP
ncbi:MAG: bile acid:sodium symporter [Halioglobus sp.]